MIGSIGNAPHNAEWDQHAARKRVRGAGARSPGGTKVKIGVCLDRDTHRSLRALALALDTTQSEIVETAVRAAIALRASQPDVAKRYESALERLASGRRAARWREAQHAQAR